MPFVPLRYTNGISGRAVARRRTLLLGTEFVNVFSIAVSSRTL